MDELVGQIGQLGRGYRAYGLLFAAYFVFLMFLPAKWMFLLGGVSALVGGCFFLGSHPGPAIIGLLVGIALIILSVRTAILDHRREVEEAESVAEEMARRARARSRR